VTPPLQRPDLAALGAAETAKLRIADFALKVGVTCVVVFFLFFL
jgi:hypothetical protein